MEIADEAENSREDQKLAEEAILEGQAGAFLLEGEGEYLRMKVLGKPYSGKLSASGG